MHEIGRRVGALTLALAGIASACAPAQAESPGRNQDNRNIPTQAAIPRTQEFSDTRPEVTNAKRYFDAFLSGDINQVLNTMDPESARQSRSNPSSMRNLQANIDLYRSCKDLQYRTANVTDNPTQKMKIVTFTFANSCEISPGPGGKITVKHIAITEYFSPERGGWFGSGAPTSTP